MNTQRPRVYYTAVFLQVSFEAIKHSMAGKASDRLPCWLDGKMLTMLCRDLKACRDEAASRDEAREALETACIECDALIGYCPGGLDSTLCHRHLNAILVALHDAIEALDTPPVTASPSRLWQSAAQHLRQGWRRLS
jgi:TRAP-type uncharacterized transport system fused permease subunit